VNPQSRVVRLVLEGSSASFALAKVERPGAPGW
jgi:hypothetical protein